jgi:hypothetical protein
LSAFYSAQRALEVDDENQGKLRDYDDGNGVAALRCDACLGCAEHWGHAATLLSVGGDGIVRERRWRSSA